MNDPTSRRNDAEAMAPETAADMSPGDMVPAEQVKAALEAAAEFKDKMLRSLAEMENLRRRTEREVADARQYGVTSFARDVLQVADNMHRALDVIGDELRNSNDANVKSLVEGLDLTERELMKVLEKHGVKIFSPLGEKFDPNFHQAMFEIADSSHAPGTVAQVVQAGYLIGDRVLRPAMVAVAKAAPKPQVPSANDNGGAAS
ncbi:MAG: Heat shock protein GrpE [Pseudolabrys sp.]|jgi:molecular chaperone GrpE|nr:Heat shock protein GrpE [Pseudolabrys sp.]